MKELQPWAKKALIFFIFLIIIITGVLGYNHYSGNDCGPYGDWENCDEDNVCESNESWCGAKQSCVGEFESCPIAQDSADVTIKVA